jgi:taurine dioxygenase
MEAGDATTALPAGATPQSRGVARAAAQRTRLAELDAAAKRHGWELEHLSPTLGTVVHGIDLVSELLLEGPWNPRASAVGAVHDSHRESHRRTLRQIFAERGAVFFHGQSLDLEQHMALAELFGPLETRHPFARLNKSYGHPGGHSEIMRIVHDPSDIGTENNWHTDLSAQPHPPAASLLVARQMPALGGDTMFADMEAAYESLPPTTKRRLCSLVAGHKLNPVTVELVREQYSEDDKAWFNEHWPGNLAGGVIEHPLVRTHPVTNRACLYISPQQVSRSDQTTDCDCI